MKTILRLQTMMVLVAIAWVWINWNLVLPSWAHMSGSACVVVLSLGLCASSWLLRPKPHRMTALIKAQKEEGRV
jgi:hypothetical protein